MTLDRRAASLEGAGSRTLELAVIDDALIEGVRRRIVEAFNPEAIYLFGSAARGEAAYTSDFDLLVVMELPPSERSIDLSRRIHALYTSWRLPLNIVVMAPGAFTKRGRLRETSPVRSFGRASAWMDALPPISPVLDWKAKGDGDLRSASVPFALHAPESDTMARLANGLRTGTYT